MAEVDFLFDNQLISELTNLIKNSKHKLLLISPYIDLDARIQDALSQKLKLHNFELQVLFGKNENNYLKSIKKDSLEFFKQFPNIEIRYSERLHAKFYLNDFEYIVTSLNLYDFSLANNIEVGVRCKYAMTGLVGKALNFSGDLVSSGVDKLNHDVIGLKKEINPIEEFKSIFQNSDLKYKTQPIVVEQSGIKGLAGYKKLDGFKVVTNNLETNFISTTAKNITIALTQGSKTETPTITSDVKVLSASQIGKKIGISSKELTSFMQQKGLIDGDKITPIGISKGLVLKTYMGNDYIAYPENLQEWNELK